METYNQKAEELLLKMAQEKKNTDKELLNLEIFIGILVSIIFIACVFVASFVNMQDWLRIVLIIIGAIPFIIGVGYAIRIEQVAGFYEYMGFKTYKRTELDEQGNPYPILYMRLEK